MDHFQPSPRRVSCLLWSSCRWHTVNQGRIKALRWTEWMGWGLEFPEKGRWYCLLLFLYCPDVKKQSHRSQPHIIPDTPHSISVQGILANCISTEHVSTATRIYTEIDRIGSSSCRHATFLVHWYRGSNSIQVGKGLGLGLRNHQQHGKLGEKHHWARHQKHQWFRSIAPQVAGAETGFCIGTRCLNPSASSTFWVKLRETCDYGILYNIMYRYNEQYS